MTSFKIKIGLVSVATVAGFAAITAADAQLVPTDAAPVCAIAPSTFAAMFDSGTVTLNGSVKAADSTVVLTPNCPFFSWSHQMFLWLTSPAPRRYGGGSHIMFSPSFYTVTPEDSSGRRTFLPNQVGRPVNMLLRATELGPHGLPALVSKSGQVIEVARPDRAKPVPPVIRLQSGALMRVTDVSRDAQGLLRFVGPNGAVLQPRRLVLPKIARPVAKLESGRLLPVVSAKALDKAIQARKFIIRGIPVFIDANNAVIDVESGQADGGVLLSQNNSLIYYITVVNDVFAYHRTMHGAAVIPPVNNITFPKTTADANAVKLFAAAHGHTITDPQALAVESKSSWIEASSVPNPADYISVNATVPTFDKSDPNMWKPGAPKVVKLVMVGIHVVGSTNGHGEMVWGSFEHMTSAPNAAYSYTAKTGPSTTVTKTVPQNTTGAWLFTPSGSAGPFNPMNASFDSGNIIGTPVSSSPILRMFPWGSSGSNVGLNTQVISANASVISQLIPGDIRARYFQLGSTWTIGGAPPNGSNQVGTNQLANATIESFAQGTNCFSCHGTNTVSVSHIYRELKPLF